MSGYAVTEREAMERALALARGGWGRVAPNPLVGAVLCRDGRILAEGYHAEFGGAHAEVAALAGCEDPRGATCVVTLEPCAHHGKTAPCAEALAGAGIVRVVYAVDDPHPEGRGGGEALRRAGVQVESGLCRDRGAALNAPFLFAASHSERPFVALKLATSLDGFLADRTGRSQWISGPVAREYVHWLRAGFDAIAVGRRTAVADDPQLTARGPTTPRIPPVRVILSRSGQVDRGLSLVRTAGEVPTILLVDPAAARETARRLEGSAVEVLAASGIRTALAALRSRGIHALLVEGGGEVARALLDEGLVDRVYWIQAPLWLGSGVPAFGGSGKQLDDAARWTPTERKSLGDDTLLVVDRELCLRGS